MKLTLETLYSGVGFIKEVENLDEILNSEPKKEWIKELPNQKGVLYLPIDKVEFLLNRLFTKIKIEIRSVISSDKRAVVTVRINYGDGMFHDGVGAAQINNSQTAEMAFPLAKSLAFKDCADCFGRIFGKDLNRNRDVSTPVKQNTISEADQKFIDSLTIKVSKIGDLEALNDLFEEILPEVTKGIESVIKAIFTKKKVSLNG